MLDRLLRIAADRAGAPSGIRFTERQLYYELCRTVSPLHRMPSRLPGTLPAPVSYPAFEAALRRCGELPGLLTLTPPRIRPAGRHTPEPDLFDYGLPRLLVCESEAVAQMLRANGLPMESACPVLSASELPLDPGITRMLTRTGRSAVYLLHDASTEGLTFPARLRELTDIPPGIRVVPLGLRPRQVRALHLTHQRSVAPTATAAQHISPERTLEHGIVEGGRVDSSEAVWLHRGRVVELEAVRPAALLRTVHRLVREVPPTRSAVAELRRVRTAGFLTWPAA